MAQPRINLLMDRPPKTVMVDGVEYAINSNFYIGIRFELLMQDPQIKGYELYARALSLYYERIPHDPEKALNAALWFYGCGHEPTESPSGGKAAVQAYSFDVDDALIYAAFLEQYGIDLCEIPYLHWWKFRALFEGLHEDHKLCRIMHYRTAEIDRKWPKAQRDHYAEMKRRYAITTAPVRRLTLRQRDQRWKAYVEKRLSGR